jgi:uncharacterized protein YfeS
MHDKIIAVIQALNQIEVKGKVNAAYLVAAINTLESVIKEDGEIKKEEVRRDE